MGTKTLVEDKEKGSHFEYVWKTYSQVQQDVFNFADIIVKNQLYNEVSDPDFGITLKVAGICSVNREEWIITDLASNMLGVTAVPLYETLGHSTMVLILQ